MYFNDIIKSTKIIEFPILKNILNGYLFVVNDTTIFRMLIIIILFQTVQY